jgi:hypothetical protein
LPGGGYKLASSERSGKKIYWNASYWPVLSSERAYNFREGKRRSGHGPRKRVRYQEGIVDLQSVVIEN